MKNLAMRAVVTSADGFYYREEHEWHNLPSDPQSNKWWNDKFTDIVKMLERFSNNAQDDGLVVTLGMTIDGETQADMVVKGISYAELHAFQRYWHRLSDELLSIGESLAHEKDRKHGWHNRPNRVHGHMKGK